MGRVGDKDGGDGVGEGGITDGDCEVGRNDATRENPYEFKRIEKHRLTRCTHSRLPHPDSILSTTFSHTKPNAIILIPVIIPPLPARRTDHRTGIHRQHLHWHRQA